MKLISLSHIPFFVRAFGDYQLSLLLFSVMGRSSEVYRNVITKPFYQLCFNYKSLYHQYNNL